MAWCPKCRFEYVAGITECPDCKVKLVDSLDPEDTTLESVANDELSDDDLPFMGNMAPSPEQLEMIERMKMVREMPVYKAKEDQYAEHKSGSTVLIGCGLAGIIVLLLSLVGVINLPFQGFTRILMYCVMGFLFCVFVFSGIRSLLRLKVLKPLVEKEKADIESVVEFIKNNKVRGIYSIDKKSEDYEALYIALSEKVVADVDKNFPDLEPGFSFYIVDRFAGDILDED